MFKWMRDNLKIIMVAVVVVFIITCGVMYGVSSGKGSNGKGMNDAVAKVNGKKVERSEVEQRASNIIEQESRAIPGMQQNADNMYLYRKQALESIGIEDELRKEIKKRNIKVDKKELNKRVDEIIAQFPTKEEFNERLARTGKSKSDFKDDVRFQMEQQLLIDGITEAAKVTEDETKKFYEEGKNSMFVIPAGCKMLIAVFGNKASAEMAKKAIEGGAKWDNIMKEQKAEQFSQEAKPELVPMAQMSSEPLASLKSLGNGKISEVKQMPGTEKYFLFLKVSEEKEQRLTYDQVKNDIVKMIKNQKGGMELRKLLKGFRKNLNIEVLDKEYFMPPKKAEPAAKTTDKPAEQQTPANKK